ncbi:cell surface lipoprotein MPT83 [Streptomyces xiamenensis]|uniref:Cell surface lipoprotein MPT83 n=1 Tax=Streptomyces xiamenensis TaxID=408015 RepID=A0A0F7G0P0_9ACTN|nr:fasciclin domain-containing protein [Streptomyces xiamenensis]AKG46234.1 cell surface lipoprotein MPT83 [Streptomyces xiamenensis]
MRINRIRRATIAVTAAAVLPLSLAACSSDDNGSSGDQGSSESTEGTTGGGMDEGEDTGADDSAQEETGAAAQTFGAACAATPAEGPGSFDGMALDPVATAAGNNEALTTLVSAVDAAGLVDTLNDADGITVFAPVNDAFAAIPEEDLNAVLADQDMLTGILTYHVVGERLSPEQLEDGSFETLQGGTVTTTGSGESFTVNDEAAVVCGNVQTANATVYLIDTVLMP